MAPRVVEQTLSILQLVDREIVLKSGTREISQYRVNVCHIHKGACPLASCCGVFTVHIDMSSLMS